MARRTRADTAVEAAEADPAGPVRTPWHDRPAVLIASAFVGVGALVGLVISVVDVSEESAHPDQRPATAASATATPASESSTTTSVVVTPPEPPPALPAVTAVPDFAAGPTAETLVPPMPSDAAPAPIELPLWLRRLLHQDDGPS